MCPCAELSDPCMTLPSSPKCLLSILSMEGHYPAVSREQLEFQVNPDKPEWNWTSSRDNVYDLFHTRGPHKEGQSPHFQRKQCQGKVSHVGLHRLAQHGAQPQGDEPVSRCLPLLFAKSWMSSRVLSCSSGQLDTQRAVEPSLPSLTCRLQESVKNTCLGDRGNRRTS